MAAKKSLAQTEREMKANDPAIEVGQLWECFIPEHKGKPFRVLRILAEHPFPDDVYAEKNQKVWIVDEQDSIHTRNTLGVRGRMHTTPEFNLRYVFRPRP